MTSPTPPRTFEPDLALIERRLAVLRQERRFHPTDPLWVLFNPAELRALFGTEETHEDQ